MISVAVILILGAAYFFFNPAENPFFPSCPFKSATGLDCPGCGSQRAIHELLHLNFKSAFIHNPLIVVAIPVSFLYLIFSIDAVKNKFPKRYRLLFNRISFYIFAVIVLLFFIFRNM